MKCVKNTGFTIVETMLFLGITGLMVMSILAGAGRSINIQRYHDSINSLQSFLQQQYSDVTNTINNRNNDWKCDTAGVMNSPNPDNPNRGQSECVILGRLIRTPDIASSPKGKQIDVYDVVGYMPAKSVWGLDEIQVFKPHNPPPPGSPPGTLALPDGYGTYISVVDKQTYDIGWDASMVKPSVDDRLDFSMLIIRSPISGNIRTFITKDFVADANINNIVSSIALANDLKVCLNSNGLFTGPRMGVYINAGASSASDIITKSEVGVCSS